MSDETWGEAPPFAVQRLGVVMEPQPDDPAEAWGVLNPAAARGPDGGAFLLAGPCREGHHLRHGLARRRLRPGGLPGGVGGPGPGVGAQGADQPNAPTGGGGEGPPGTPIPPPPLYVMAYTA